MDLPHDHPAVATFLAFSAETDRWAWTLLFHLDRVGKDESLTEREHVQFLAESRQDIEGIFRQYCDACPNAAENRSGCTSYPPDYDAETVTILSVTQGRTLVRITTINPSVLDVRTSQPDPKNQHRYTLVEQLSRWLIRGRDYTFDEGKTWRRTTL